MIFKEKKHNIFSALIIILILFSSLPLITSSQSLENEVSSITWSNNALLINTKDKIIYAESRLKDPDRLVVDILNCSLPATELEKNFKSTLGENISVSQPVSNQVRIIFLGESSINRKAYLTNYEKTLVIKIVRIGDEKDDETISENKDQTELEKYAQGDLKEIEIEGDENETEVSIYATKSVKYNTYLLKNPARLAVDLLNIFPPTSPLPKYMATHLVSGVRVGRAANGLEAARIVIDLTNDNIDYNIDPSLLGNKIRIKFRPSRNKEEAKKISSLKIVIDPGHGGYDTGASYGGFEEKNVNLVIAEKLKKLLENYGITVILTRDDDSFLSLAERVEITNSIKPNVFISIHGNAMKTTRAIRGVETYYWTHQSQKLAYYVHTSILNNLEIPDHYIRRAKFYVIKYTSVPAILAELGFLSNHEDRKLLTSSASQDQYAKALTTAILKFLDIEPKKDKEKKETEQKKPEEKKEVKK